MSRTPPLAASLLACLAALAALATSGCIAPAKIGAVEGDTVLGPLQALVPDAPAPLAAAPPTAAPERNDEAPVEPVVVEARPLTEPPPREPSLVARQIPLPMTNQQPPDAPAPTQPAGAQRVKPIHEISLDITPAAAEHEPIQPPANEAAAALAALAGEQPFTRGAEIDYGYDVVPAVGGLEMCYQPLYFQELNAERYGRSWGILQPAVSVANFYGRIPCLPYLAVARPARRCTYDAHWALPGYKIPGREPYPHVLSPAGGVAQTAALFGVILLIP